MLQESVALRLHLPSLRQGLLTSAAAHVAFLLAVSILAQLFHAKVRVLRAGTGGGQGGEIVRVGLAGTDGGNGELFKPALRPEPPAPAPKEVPEAAKTPANKDAFPTGARKTKKTTDRPEAGKVAKSAQNVLAPNVVPRETSPGTAGDGRSAGSGGGFGGGQGIHIGTGSGGEGLMDSWYARQVEKRIGENWLRANFESLAGQRLTTVIRFDILPDGRIANIVVERRSGVTFYDVAAERAVRSSTPLPRPPSEFYGSAVRFVCYFEYPPGTR